MQGISKLDYLQLVSINQKVTNKFAANLFRNQKWGDLDSGSKQHLRDLFNIKTRRSTIFSEGDNRSLASEDFPSIHDPIIRESSVNEEEEGHSVASHDSEEILS